MEFSDEEEEVAGEGSGFTHAWAVESTDFGCGEAWAIAKRAGICISHTGSRTGGGASSLLVAKAGCRQNPT